MMLPAIAILEKIEKAHDDRVKELFKTYPPLESI
jgi:hypothetical protein